MNNPNAAWTKPLFAFEHNIHYGRHGKTTNSRHHTVPFKKLLEATLEFFPFTYNDQSSLVTGPTAVILHPVDGNISRGDWSNDMKPVGRATGSPICRENKAITFTRGVT